MKISEILQAESGLSGFVVTGEIAKIYDSKPVSGTKNGKDWSFESTSIKLKDGEDEIYVQFIDVDTNFKNLEGRQVTCISCSINDYIDKNEVKQRSIRAKDCSLITVQEDTAEPPKTTVVETTPIERKREPIEYKLTPREKDERNYWIEKDTRTALMIARQHSNTDATSLIVKFFEGTLEEATAQVILISNMLVDSVYQGMREPQQEKNEKPMHNVITAPATPLQIEAIELKTKMQALTGDDIRFHGDLDDMYGADDVLGLDSVQMKEFNAHISRLIMGLEQKKLKEGKRSSSAPVIQSQEELI